MMTLNEITMELQKFHEALNANGGEVEPAAASLGMTAEQFLKDYDAVAFADGAKLDAYIHQMEKMESQEAADQSMYDQWKARADEYLAAVRSSKKQRDFMKERIKTNMQVKGETKITTPEGRKLAIQANGGVVWPKVDEDAFNKLDRDVLELLEKGGILVLQPMLNRKALLEAIERGEIYSFAQAGERGTHVRIK